MAKDTMKIEGSRCPDCGEKLRYPQGFDPCDDAWNEDPHPDPRECIRHLRKELGRVITRRAAEDK